MMHILNFFQKLSEMYVGRCFVAYFRVVAWRNSSSISADTYANYILIAGVGRAQKQSLDNLFVEFGQDLNLP